ncbi:hypothetical protein BURC_02820 [Burkholderiaceae bacterium]|nr:hypothetical protein BURC_02820 [Burkholderiaceae bacterium]
MHEATDPTAAAVIDEADACAVWLLRAFESPPAVPWSEADAEWATREAQRQEGEAASPARFLARRARLGCERLAQREVAAAQLPWRAGVSPWWGAGLVLAAFVLGWGSDAVTSAQRINILAPPVLALLLWSLLVYLLLALGALRGAFAGRAKASTPGMPSTPGPLRRVLLASIERALSLSWLQGRGKASAPLARFAATWTEASRGLHAARLASVLHAAAAALAFGALCSLYARGLAFEYRAGWDSTFLSPAAVHSLLSLVLGPASSWSGITLPSAEQIAQLRFSAGPGENAARWIHLYAITLGVVVLLPRLGLSVAAAWRAHRLSARMTLPLADPYFRRLLQAHSGHMLAVQVLPYSYRLPPALLPGLRSALEQMLGARVAPQLAEPVALGAEDTMEEMPAATGGTPAPVRVALFPLTATPERENHGAFVRALSASSAARLLVLVDESGFRERFRGPDGEARRAQRRGAWQRMLHDEGHAPLFADLSAASPEPSS